MTLTDQELAELERLHQAATAGEWDVWRERTNTRDAAVLELMQQVEDTEPFAGAVFLLNAGGKCPVTTGCGPTSEANAAAIVAAHNALPALIAEIRRLRKLALDLDAAATLGFALGDDADQWLAVRNRIAEDGAGAAAIRALKDAAA